MASCRSGRVMGLYDDAVSVLADPRKLGGVYRAAWGVEPRVVLVTLPVPPGYVASLVAGARGWERFSTVHVSEVVDRAVAAALYSGGGEGGGESRASLGLSIGPLKAGVERGSSTRGVMDRAAARRLAVDTLSTISRPTVVLVPPGWLASLGEELADVAYSNGRVVVVAYSDWRSARAAGRLAACDNVATLFTVVDSNVVNKLDNVVHWGESRLPRLRAQLAALRSTGARYAMASLASPLLAAHAIAYAAALMATVGDTIEPGDALIQGVHHAKRAFLTPAVVYASLAAARHAPRSSWWKLGVAKLVRGGRAAEGPVKEMARLYRSDARRYARLAAQYAAAAGLPGGAAKRRMVNASDAAALATGSS